MRSSYLKTATWRFALQLSTNKTQRKHVFRWLISLQKDYLLKYKQPWLCFDAIDFLDVFDFKDKTVFEFGSGGSTLYWLSKGANCITIEHDHSWYIKLKQCLPKNRKLDYRLIEPENDVENSNRIVDFSDPNQYLSSEYSTAKFHYQRYVQQIDDFPEESIDVVLIDGRARPSCIQHSIMKIKQGGLLILDNSDREYYTSKTSHLLHAFECHKFIGTAPQAPVFTATSVYLKKR